MADFIEQNSPAPEPTFEGNERYEAIRKYNEPKEEASAEPNPEPVDTNEIEVGESQTNDSAEPQESTEEAQTNDQKPSKPKISNREAKRLAYHNKQLQQRLDEMEAKLNALNKPAEERKATKADFRNEEDYIEYVAQQKLVELERRRTEEQLVQTRQEKNFNDLKSSWDNKITKNFPTDIERDEYLESLENLGHPSEALDERINNYIFKNPVGPKMIKYLSDRQNIIPTLKSMHDFDLAVALQKISQYVAQTSQNKPIQHKQSSAPGPIGKLGSGSIGAVKNVNEMSDAELMKAYRSGKLKF